MVVDGRGPQGFVKATASIELVAEGTGTRVKYDSDAQVGGKIASVGQRLVETSAKAIVKQSLEGLAENIKIRSTAYRAQAAEPEPEPKPVLAAVAPAGIEPAGAAPAGVAPVGLAVIPPPEPIAKPVIQYKQADAGKLAGAVAKEVTKTLAPVIGVAVIVLAIVIYLIVR